MNRLIALLRGINVGGHRIKMDKLRSLFEDMGFEDVATVIASGNVIFSTNATDEAELRDRIQDHLHEELGYEVETFLRTPAELAAVAEIEGEGAVSHYVIFLHEPPAQDLKASLAGLASDFDSFAFIGREIHWRLRGRMSESPLFGGALEKAVRGTPTTTRNMTSLRKMVAKT